MPSVFLSLAVLVSSSAAWASVPTEMTAMISVDGPCSAPGWSCLRLSHTVLVPQPGEGELLIRMKGSSVAPLVLELVEPRCKAFPPPFACANGTIGVSGGSGVVAALGPHCDGISIGDEVWSNPSASYAEYAIAKCAATGLKPKKLSFAEAGVALEGVTSLQCLQMAGAPWTKPNLTVAITAGQGGTGVLAIQLARAFGASHVATAATGAGISLVKSLGADLVVDYRAQELFAALPDDSVDVVFDNLGMPGTADKAMHAIRPGGVYLLLTGGGGAFSKNPKAGVRQLQFYAVDTSNRTKGLDVLAPMFDAASDPLRVHIFQQFRLADVPAAFTAFRNETVVGKMAIAVS